MPTSVPIRIQILLEARRSRQLPDGMSESLGQRRRFHIRALPRAGGTALDEEKAPTWLSAHSQAPELRFAVSRPEHDPITRTQMTLVPQRMMSQGLLALQHNNSPAARRQATP